MLEQVESLEALVRQGELELARERLAQLDASTLTDPDLLVRLADLSQELGWIARLVVELNRAYALAPHRLDLLRRLGQVHSDGGRTVRAVKCWKAITERDPSDVEAWEELGAALASLERHEEAREIYRKAEERTGDRRFAALARGTLERRPSLESPAEDLDEAVLTRFTHLFAGREGVYARQWVNAHGETGYSPIREPFTASVARSHLEGVQTVGSYLLRVDNTVNFAAIDLDLPRELLARGSRRETFQRMRELLLHALRLVSLSGLPLHVEESGLKGFHIWFMFGQPLPARVARRLALAVAARGGPVPSPASVEVFPKQVQLPPDGLGNLIKLPLGVHRVSGNRGRFLNESGFPVEQPYRWLLNARTLSREEVTDYLERCDDPSEEPEEEPPPGGRPNLLDYHLDADLSAQRLLAGCCTLRALADRALYESRLNHDEARVLIHTLGHLDSGPQAVNALLRRAPELDASLYQKSRQRGQPMSCARIRQRLPGLTSTLPCHCEFAPGSGLYPSPLLHLESEGAPAALQLRALVDDYLRCGRELREAQSRHAALVARLTTWFDMADTDEISGPNGLLRRLRDDQGQSSFRLET